ncbi:UNVERIFIED_CONTAM: hypothetical protein Sradi_3789600 [Sesamum radiatum]|uniref:Uncharacterized protein n=1 Tax=Sesamum radiatum TaxID=300843 RepID=A0AAW2Q0C9_SESRA
MKFDGVVIKGTLLDAALGVDADGGGGGNGATDEEKLPVMVTMTVMVMELHACFPSQHDKGVE